MARAPKQPDMTIALAAIRRDPKLRPLVRKFGPPDLTKYHANSRTIFEALLRSIIYQQVSGHAARAIHARVIALFNGEKPSPTQLLKLRPARLRSAGLSLAKVRYARDLAKKCLDGTIDEKDFPRMSSHEIIEHLVRVDGIGEWTAQMMLIFKLYRLDILPVGDLAIRKGFQIVYGLASLPNRREMEAIAKPWQEYATVAAWYLWRAVDEAKGTDSTGVAPARRATVAK